MNFIDLKKKGVLQQDVLSVDQKGSFTSFLKVNKQMGQQGVDLSEYNAIFCCLRINGGIIGSTRGWDWRWSFLRPLFSCHMSGHGESVSKVR